MNRSVSHVLQQREALSRAFFNVILQKLVKRKELFVSFSWHYRCEPLTIAATLQSVDVAGKNEQQRAKSEKSSEELVYIAWQLARVSYRGQTTSEQLTQRPNTRKQHQVSIA